MIIKAFLAFYLIIEQIFVQFIHHNHYLKPIMADKKQQQMKEDIKSYQNKKDYYQILGVSKSATETDIKKAYRNLALRYHPDKNSHQGAKDVFKKVSNAYTILTDQQKRQHYDRFGPEQERPRPQQRQHYNQEDYQYEQFNDVFNAFFGGAHQQARRGNVFTFNVGGNRFQQRGGQGNQQQGGISFYYVFIIIFVIYTILPLFESKPNYSSTFSGQYKYKRYTSHFNVEFYVNEKYMQEAKDPQYKRFSQMVIDREHMMLLEKQCQGVKREKRRLEEIAYREKPGPRRDSYISSAKLINLNSCKALNGYRADHEDYVRDLTYMK